VTPNIIITSLFDAHLASMNYNEAKIPLGPFKIYPFIFIYPPTRSVRRKTRPFHDLERILRPQGSFSFANAACG
jgi:hypothetical protein